MPGFLFEDPSLNQGDWSSSVPVLAFFYVLVMVAFLGWKTGGFSESSRLAALKRFREEREASAQIVEEDFQTWSSEQTNDSGSEQERREQYAALPRAEKKRELERSINKNLRTTGISTAIILAGGAVFVCLSAIILAVLTAPLVSSVYSRSDPRSGDVGSATHELSRWLTCHYGFKVEEDSLRRVASAMVDIDRGAALPTSISSFLAPPARPLNVPGVDDAFFVRQESGIWVIQNGQGEPVEGSNGKCQ